MLEVVVGAQRPHVTDAMPSMVIRLAHLHPHNSDSPQSTNLVYPIGAFRSGGIPRLVASREHPAPVRGTIPQNA